MKINFSLLAAALFITGGGSLAFAQEIILQSDGTNLGTLSVSAFTTSNGVSTLSLTSSDSSSYVSDLSTDASLNPAVASLFAPGTGGWVFSTSTGTAVVESSQVSDPSVNIFGAFFNTDAGSATTPDTFSSTVVSNFNSTSYAASAPATTFASFHAGLTDSQLNSNGASANINLMGYLNNSPDGSVPAAPQTNLGFNESGSLSLTGGTSGTIVNNTGMTLTPQAYGGSYNQLEGIVSGSYTYGSIVTFNGRITVDTVPEPLPASLLLVGACLGLFLFLRRSANKCVHD